jgi:hypothetical protein
MRPPSGANTALLTDAGARGDPRRLHAVISLASERFTKNLWSGRPSSDRPRLVTVAEEIDQTRYLAARLLENRESGTALKAQAGLFRRRITAQRSRSSSPCGGFPS